MRPAFAAMIVFGLAVLGLSVAAMWYGMAWRMGWFEGPPRIARGLFAAAGSVSQPWTDRLQRRFPIGASEADLTAELRRQGFEIDGRRNAAGYGWARYPCIYTLTVRWRTDGTGRVRDVQGGLHNACTETKRMLPDAPMRRRGGGGGGERSPLPLAPPLVQGAQSA